MATALSPASLSRVPRPKVVSDAGSPMINPPAGVATKLLLPVVETDAEKETLQAGAKPLLRNLPKLRSFLKCVHKHGPVPWRYQIHAIECKENNRSQGGGNCSKSGKRKLLPPYWE